MWLRSSALDGVDTLVKRADAEEVRARLLYENFGPATANAPHP